jgi:hypothetical protein
MSDKKSDLQIPTGVGALGLISLAVALIVNAIGGTLTLTAVLGTAVFVAGVAVLASTAVGVLIFLLIFALIGLAGVAAMIRDLARGA